MKPYTSAPLVSFSEDVERAIGAIKKAGESRPMVMMFPSMAAKNRILRAVRRQLKKPA